MLDFWSVVSLLRFSLQKLSEKFCIMEFLFPTPFHIPYGFGIVEGLDWQLFSFPPFLAIFFHPFLQFLPSCNPKSWTKLCWLWLHSMQHYFYWCFLLLFFLADDLFQLASSSTTLATASASLLSLSFMLFTDLSPLCQSWSNFHFWHFLIGER